MVVRDEDGNEIKLTILKKPIDLANVKCVYEENSAKEALKKEIRKFGKRKNITFETKKNKKATGVLLKEPLSLEEAFEKGRSDNTPVNFNVKIVKNAYLIKTSQRRNSPNCQTWKQNALTLFEYSYVYPFIHALNKYKCFVCGKIFLDAGNLREHSIRDHSIKDLKKELNNRVRDKNLKVDVSVMQCKICLSTCDDLKSLKIHLKEHGKPMDSEFQDNIIPFKLGDTNFECQICRESFPKLRSLIIHMSKHFNNYSCETCGSTFISLHLLNRHLQTHVVGNFPCDKCNKVFSNPAKRTLHYKVVHLKQLLRTCPICPERFNSNYQRTKHLRKIHNQCTALFRCETCGREYDLKYQLIVHIRSVHMQERNQECEICQARFFSKYCLSRHMVVHTQEKNFKCEVCGKAYARPKHLKDHVKLHGIELVCSVCERNFGDQTSLAAHINDTHGVL